jgi:hypothetical protein
VRTNLLRNVELTTRIPPLVVLRQENIPRFFA